MLKQYEKLDKDPLLFVHWMKKKCQANSGHARKTFEVVKCLPMSVKNVKKTKDIQSKNNLSPAMQLSSTSNATPTALKSAVNILNQSTPYSTVSLSTKSELIPMNAIKPVSDMENDEKVGLNQHLLKLREQFTNMHDTANKKMLELQLELCKMQHMSHEFDVLAEFLSSEEKLSGFEQNLDRLQKTVQLTEEKIHEINTNNQKMGTMIRKINDTAKMQHESNAKTINSIEEKLTRWELKLDRAARKMFSQKIDIGDSKPADHGQLKDDIENMLNGRLEEFSTNMEWMKNVIFGFVVLIVLKTILFDLVKKNEDNSLD